MAMRKTIRHQAIFGITGRSGSGKTHLLARLLPALRARGLKVSTIKHTHHTIDIDKPGKDSFVHRDAGASEVMLATPDRWVLQHTQPDEPFTLPDLLARMTPVDLILIEGFHATVPACLEIYRPSVGKAPLFGAQSNIIAVATDTPEAVPAPLAALDLNDTEALAAFILERTVQIPLG
ncbi:molybdopterin-guanine dinucleotide biosynthesis protein B [Acetobacter cerevisiae]|nr:molybdopterin-guanine dinucleotide biosynthesis protein B [Acetobacter cerevisiae]MCP1270981.1 molybdopterin-guanine dinucleotide biosynthesis protein B [Acetobacter cerevisiae]MCP1278969.1 molybdopterin-guanine dinucleotide biosynthesis protein B [Acetobacter cerevisiae]